MITNLFQILKSRKLEFKGTLPFRQSEICNNTPSPIFRKLQLIEQWGTGFEKLSDELKEYPEIELKINEPGLSFQLQFIKRDYQSEKGEDQAGTKLGPSWDQVGIKSALSRHQVDTKLALSREEVQKLLFTAKNPISITYLMEIFNWKDRSKFRDIYINPILELELVQMTIPEKPNSSKQKYLITEKGKLLLEELEVEDNKQSSSKYPASTPQDGKEREELK